MKRTEQPAKEPPKTRIALYSPGIVGLGHMRRNLLIAKVLAESDLQPVILMVTEAREASVFINSMPAGVDCITLPGLSKGVDGACKPRYLDLPLKQLISLRARTIRAALKEFDPDLFIVDNLPRGAYRELDPALRQLKAGGHTKCVLGLRDVLDEPWSVHRDWFRWRFDEAIDAYFESIWVYGDSAVYNMADEYRFPPNIAEKIQFVGYLDQRRRLSSNAAECDDPVPQSLPEGKLILCLLGGGQDGNRLAEAFVASRFPPGTTGILVTGPFMPAEVRQHLEQRAADNPSLRIVKFIPEPTTLVRQAERIIGMGGYNTVCEALSFEKPLLVIPRVKPRREQLIRAQRMRDLGILDMLEPERLSPDALSEWMWAEPPRVPAKTRLDMNGLERLPAVAASLLKRGDETTELWADLPGVAVASSHP